MESRTKIFRGGPYFSTKIFRGGPYFSKSWDQNFQRNFGPRTIFTGTNIPVTEQHSATYTRTYAHTHARTRTRSIANSTCKRTQTQINARKLIVATDTRAISACKRDRSKTFRMYYSLSVFHHVYQGGSIFMWSSPPFIKFS